MTWVWVFSLQARPPRPLPKAQSQDRVRRTARYFDPGRGEVRSGVSSSGTLVFGYSTTAKLLFNNAVFTPRGWRSQCTRIRFEYSLPAKCATAVPHA